MDMKEFDDFINKIEKTDRVAVLHDRDPDGICSGLIAVKGLKKLNFDITLRLNQEPSERILTKKSIEKLKKAGIMKLITCDLPLDHDASTVKQAEEFCEILVLDHHKRADKITSDRTTLIKGLKINGEELTSLKCPTSMLAYQLFSRVTDITNLKWIASVGTIADGGQEQWKDFIDETMKIYGVTFEDLANIAKTISSMCLREEEKLVEEIFNGIKNSKRPQDILANTKYNNFRREMLNEINKWSKEIEEEITPEKKVVFKLIKPKLPIGSPLATKLTFTYHDKTFIICEDNGKEFIHISFRRQDGVDVASLAKKLVKGIGQGGGHPVASGANVPKEHFAEFKKRVMRYMKEQG